MTTEIQIRENGDWQNITELECQKLLKNNLIYKSLDECLEDMDIYRINDIDQKADWSTIAEALKSGL